MQRRCRYCDMPLDSVTPVNEQFCSDAHRLQYHNEKQHNRILLERAVKAIDELEQIAASKSLFSKAAQRYLKHLQRRLSPPVTDDEKQFTFPIIFTNNSQEAET